MKKTMIERIQQKGRISGADLLSEMPQLTSVLDNCLLSRSLIVHKDGFKAGPEYIIA